MNKTAIALIAGASALVSASAFAGEEKSEDWEAEFEEKFNAVDANGDGKVSQEEFLAARGAEAEAEWAKWAEAAGDDGEISLEEAKAHYAAKMAEKAEKAE